MKKIDKHNKNGFTLLEILITLAISSIVVIALYQTFDSQQKSYIIQEDVSAMQQELRASMLIITNDIRMAGYDPLLTDNFDIEFIFPRATDTSMNAGINGKSSIQMTEDLDENGTLGANERILYAVYDANAADGNFDLGRSINGGVIQPVAENIQGFGLAFAFDDDFDGALDTYPTNGGATQHIIWAIDSDGNNTLDRNLDTNSDGVIDVNDSPGGPGSNGIIVGTALAANVPISSIRGVKIWLLAETTRNDQNFNNTATYIVGKYVLTPNSNKRMRLLSTTIQCRNLGL